MNDLLSKWEKTKLLDCTDKKDLKIKLAQLLENQKVSNDQLEIAKDIQIKRETFNQVSMPMVVRLFGNNILSELVNFEVMSKPSELFKHRDVYNNIKTIECFAKNKLLQTTWNQDHLDDLYEQAPNGLDAFTEFFVNTYEDIGLEIQIEILKDLAKIAPHNVDLNWKNIDGLVETISLSSSVRQSNWAVVPIEIYEELKGHADFKTEDLILNSNSKKLQKVGKLLNKINIYVDPNVEDLEILLGFKGTELNIGYLYCPYIILSAIGQRNEQEDKNYLLFTRHSKALVNKNYYSKIIISGYSLKK